MVDTAASSESSRPGMFAYINLSLGETEKKLGSRQIATICLDDSDSDGDVPLVLSVGDDVVCLTALETASSKDDVVCLSGSPTFMNSTVARVISPLSPLISSQSSPSVDGDPSNVLAQQNSALLQQLQHAQVQLEEMKKRMAKGARVVNEPRFPKYWVARDKHGRRQRPSDVAVLPTTSSSTQIVQLSTSSPEFRTVLERFRKEGMPEAEVSAIRRVNNRTLWSRYARRRNEIGAELLNGDHTDARIQRINFLHDIVAGVDARAIGTPGSSLGHARERYLFHGACSSTIDTITEEGFDFRVANLAGAMGACTYFADQASYSHTYSSTPPNPYQGSGPHGLWVRQQGHQAPVPRPLPGGLLKMLLCRVVLGHCGRGSPGLRRPPKMQNGRLHHSVSNAPAQATDCHSKGCMFGVFDKDMAYPEYIIEYREPPPSMPCQMQTSFAVAMGLLAAAGGSTPWGRPASASTSRRKKKRQRRRR